MRDEMLERADVEIIQGSRNKGSARLYRTSPCLV
jgi:hypothetical protein